MVISIDAATLSNYYFAKAGLTASGTSSSTANTAASTTPAAPWQSASTAPQQSALVKSVLAGAKFFDPTKTQLSATPTTNAADYKNLFTLYQGINALEGLAQSSATTGTSATQLAANSAAFQKGLAQLQTYVNGTPFSAFDVATGTLTASQTTKSGAPVETDTYTTQPLYSGSASGEVPAFQGNAQFSLSVTTTAHKTTTVNFDLADLGSTPRTFGNVVNYLNGKLQAAGVSTRFADVRTPGTPETTQVNGKTVTLSTPPDSFSLEIKGSGTETVTLSAPTTAPAVYVAGATGAPPTPALASTAATAGDQSQDLLKFSTDPAADGAPVFNTPLQSAAQAARAIATAPDGSVYVLSDIDGTTADGQTIKGASDVALQKYDSAGNLVYTRTLGADTGASGYALSVSADGSKVAIAGSVTGPFDATDPGQSATSVNSFISVFSAAGDEQFTNTQASTAGDVASGVAFGSDGSVYVTGTAQSKLPGATAVGGQDGYVRGYSVSGTLKFTQTFASGTDTPAGIAVSGSSIYIAGAENGDAVVRQYAIQSTGAPTLSATRDLGALQGGNVAGVAVNADGSVVVAGSTHNGGLAVGDVTAAYQGGKEAFVASLSANLQPSSGESLAYVASSGDLTASGVTVSNGQVYLTGQVATTPPAGSGLTKTADGYVAQIDPTTGAVAWSNQFQGTDDYAAPTSVAVDAGGASILDALGLPKGTLSFAPSTSVVANTTLRAGDQFYIKTGSGIAEPVTIAADDTLQTLAQKINRASGFTVTASTAVVNGKTVLKIAPLNARTSATLISGAPGKDALGALGLTAGEVSSDVNASSTATTKAKVTLGLNLPTTLNISTATGAKTALTALQLAVAKLENAYQSFIKPASSQTASSTANSAPVPAYLTAQIADYQLALSRLQGTSS